MIIDSPIITGSLITSTSASIGTSSLGPSENTLTLGAISASAGEGGQIGFNAPNSGSWVSASFIDNYQNQFRILSGIVTSSAAPFSLNLSNGAITTTGNINGATPTEVGYLSGTTSNIQNQLNATPYYVYQALGSVAKSVSVTSPNINNISANGTLATNSARFVALYVPTTTTITGVKWFQITVGAYTSNNYNGVGLYSASAGTLTCVASSSNNGNLWSGSLQTANTWTSQSFGSTYSAQPGVYYVALLYNSSAQTTAPVIGSGPLAINAALNTFDFTNSNKIIGIVTANTLPTSQAASGLSAGTNLNYSVYLY